MSKLIRVFEFMGPAWIESRDIEEGNLSREKSAASTRGRALFTVPELAQKGSIFWEGKLPQEDADLVEAAASAQYRF